jgi:signal peptidase I
MASCAHVSTNPSTSASDSAYEPPKIVGQIKSADVTESSGLTASRCQENIFWTHNDSGDDAYIFALDLSGDNLGTWKIANAENIDWEDIALSKDKTGKCFIYIGEIGDNKLQRREHGVYRFAEPTVIDVAKSSSKANPQTIDEFEIIRFVYPDIDQNAETLMVEPKSGDIYVVTKRVSGPAGVYRIKPNFGSAETQRAEKVSDLSVPAIPNGFVTGGDISPDGRRMVICDYAQAYEWTLPDTVTQFDEIWKQEPKQVDLGKRDVGESVCYSANGTSIFATSEGRNSPVTQVNRKK